MKNFTRSNPNLSLCGLNCGLCTMHLGGHCPGCGGGEGNQSCSIARCSVERKVEYCSFCPDYPCQKYDGIDDYDSFISTRNMRGNLEKVKRIGPEAYQSELEEKLALLHILLEQYNDGRHKSPFCTAVNLLELPALKAILGQLADTDTDQMDIKVKAKLAERLLNQAAEEQGIALKMRKKAK